jgi:hypothetical protein
MATTDPAAGGLTPCETCGQSVADYRGTCPFCGASTGRPDRPPPPEAQPSGEAAPEGKKARSWRGLIVLLTVVTFVLAFAGCMALIKGHNKQTAAMSPEARAFVGRAMPALDRVLAEYQAGNDTQAAHDWSAIGDMPALTPTDLTVAEQYVAYSNAVQAYLLENGSLQQVEAARAATQAAIARAQAQ